MQAALRGRSGAPGREGCSPPSLPPQPLLRRAGHLPPSPTLDVLQGRRLAAPSSLQPEAPPRTALSGAKGKGDKCRSFKVKGSAGMMEKQPVLSAKDWRPSWRFTALRFSLCSYFRAYGKKRLIIKREILPVYPGILSCTAPALPHFPLPVLPTQTEQGWIAVLPGAVQSCRHLLLQYWPDLLSSARECTENYLQVSRDASPVCKALCLLLI